MDRYKSSPANADTGGSRGSSQAGVRAYNERLVLSLVRRRPDGLAKADIARLTGLSAQTVSVIMRGLEKDGLLVKGPPLRGRVGQPSVPMRLDPEGALSFGLKIGRRSADLVLMDFVGSVRAGLHETFPYPTTEGILRFAAEGLARLSAPLDARQRGRIAGIGVAAPFELWNWAEEVGAPAEAIADWRSFDLRARLGAALPHPIFVENDGTAACGAELAFGRGADYPDFLYVFIGSFVGGGVVLNSALYAGRTGNAGAIGSMPVPGPAGRPVQLIDAASLFILERMLKADGKDPSCLWRSPEDWSSFGDALDRWIEDTAVSLAHAIVAASSVIDFSATIIDGGFPGPVRDRVVEATRAAAGKLDVQGIQPPAIVAGGVGSNARAIGAASLPMFNRYLLSRDVLFKEAALSA